MIPQIIHYCWFGKKEIPDSELKCIESWRRYLPEFQLMLWNESNFDIDSCDYVKQAYSLGKYAFVSDYARAMALYQHGGVYLDTDVEILGSFKNLLNNKGFLGFENRVMVGTAVMGFEPESAVMKKMLDYYHSICFIDDKGNQNLTTNVTLLNNILQANGLKKENSDQEIDGIHVFERSVFFPKVTKEGVRKMPNTVAIHHMHGSWLTDRQLKRGKNGFWVNVCRPILKSMRAVLISLIGQEKSSKIECIFRNILK